MKIALALILVTFAGTGLVINSQTANRPTTNDVKIRQRISTGNSPGSETLLYIKGQRMRNEMGGDVGFTTIVQCDLKRTLTINEKTKSYLISSTDSMNTAGAVGDGGPAVAAPPTQNEPRGGVVNIVNTITDTGERKEMFGFTARRIKTSMVKTASPDACDKNSKIETDGWYIDFQYAFECPGQTQKYQAPAYRPQPGCKDDVRTKTIGTAKLGFPLLVTTTIYQPDGRTSAMTQEVLELSREPLSASLFDIPAGYTIAKDMQELYGMGAATSVSSVPTETKPANSSRESSTAKKPGVIRIGLITPTEALRNSFAGHLNRPGIEVVTLSAAQPIEEARKSQCDYILSASMTVKKGGGGGMFGRAIGNIAAAATGVPAGGMAAIKAKDEVSLEYKLDHLETSKTSLTSKDKAKASADGEDVISPLVQKAAESIVATVRR